MASSVNQSKIVIPTGFESQQRQLERKQAIAQALLEKGLAGPGANATSWTQPLASIVQVLAGRHLQRKADESQGALDTKIRGDYTSTVANIQKDILDARNSPQALQQVWFKYQDNPLVADIIKPLAERVQHMQQAGDAPRVEGGVIGTTRDFMPGNGPAITPTDARTAKLIPGPDGRLHVNPGLLEFDQKAQGLKPDLGSPKFSGMPDTRQRVVRSMLAQQAPAPEGYPAMPGSGSQPGLPAMPPEGQELPALPTAPQATPPPFSTGPDGKPYWFVNGGLYDNPEGK